MNLLEQTYDEIDKIKKNIIEIPLEDKIVAEEYLNQRLEKEILNAIDFHEILTEQIDYAYKKSKKFSWMIKKKQSRRNLFNRLYSNGNRKSK